VSERAGTGRAESKPRGAGRGRGPICPFGQDLLPVQPTIRRACFWYLAGVIPVKPLKILVK
jgi:hypothetical protein